MNETIRTSIYVGLGVLAAVAAFATRPSLRDSSTANTNLVDVKNLLGQPLFPKFDQLSAKNISIVNFDETTGKPKSFSVVQLPSGRWVIPSHNDYAADAEQQMGAMAEALAKLTVLDVASETEADHALFGVVDPEKAKVGSKGAGTLISLEDGKNESLKLIVGQEVEGRPNLHFVRKPNDPTVLVTTIDLSKLPTEFEKWIEKDLLNVSTFDVSRVSIRDYVIGQTGEGLARVERMMADLSYASDKGEWLLDKLQIFTQGGWKNAPLGEQEELNKQKLDDLRNALGDVKIVDVKRKPAGLGNGVRIPVSQLTPEVNAKLQDYGFYARRGNDGFADLFSASGEVLIETKDGVQYVLRFGEIAPEIHLGSSAAPAAGEDKQIKIHRYLFVTTQVAPSVLVPPALEVEPEAPATAAQPAASAAPPEATKAGEKAGDKPPPVIDPAQAERERIKNENKRKLDAYNDKKKKAEGRVRELNARFADWYYVVAEDVYKKIRLVRNDIVKEAVASKDEGFGIDAFRALEQGGVKPSAKPAAPAGGPGFPGGFPPM